MPRNTVVIATPTSAQQKRLGRLVDQIAEFDVICATADLMNTYTIVEERLPKAVLIADVLANLPEFEVMRALFATLDTRWLVVTTTPRESRFASKPSGGAASRSDLFSIAADAPEEVFIRQLRALTRTERQDHPAAKARPPQKAAISASVAPFGQSPALPVETVAKYPSSSPHPGKPENEWRAPNEALKGPRLSSRRQGDQTASPPRSTLTIAAESTDRLILIGASTGGVDALLTVLTRFPADCPPTMIVQHTGVGFGESLAGLLNRQCLPSVQLATGQMPVRRGEILVGAGTRSHLVLSGRSGTRTDMESDGPVAGHIPSVDKLFLSAIPVASRVSAALLTGMGRDGADGMRALFDAGAFTIAQNEASCVVYGMPRAAVQNGCVHRVLHLDQIAEALLGERVSGTPRGKELQK